MKGRTKQDFLASARERIKALDGAEGTCLSCLPALVYEAAGLGRLVGVKSTKLHQGGILSLLHPCTKGMF